MSLLIRGSLLSPVALSYHYLPSLLEETMFIQLLSVKFKRSCNLENIFCFLSCPSLPETD